MVSREHFETVLQAFSTANQEIFEKIAVGLWEYPQTRSSVLT